MALAPPREDRGIQGGGGPFQRPLGAPRGRSSARKASGVAQPRSFGLPAAPAGKNTSNGWADRPGLTEVTGNTVNRPEVRLKASLLAINTGLLSPCSWPRGSPRSASTSDHRRRTALMDPVVLPFQHRPGQRCGSTPLVQRRTKQSETPAHKSSQPRPLARDVAGSSGLDLRELQSRCFGWTPRRF